MADNKQAAQEGASDGPEDNAPEFSVPVDIRKLYDAPKHLKAQANERTALATRFGLEAINSLTAAIAYHAQGETIIAKGALSADIMQQCVISLESFASTIRQDFTISFCPAESMQAILAEGEAAEEESFEIEADDCDIMPYADGRFDIGEAVAQTLALALDPFPRGPDAEQIAQKHGLVTEVPKDNPFAVLQQLKKD
jgi:uncharacterized metal-binding protein YceD (DUF177 family)